MQQLDYFGVDASSLKEKTLFLFDMDGTIYEENRLFDGTLPLLSLIKKQGGRYVFITNNSSKSVEDYVEKLQNMGVPAEREDFYTSVQATAAYLLEHFPKKKIYCQCTKSMLAELQNAGICVTEAVCEDAAAIVVGYDTELTSAKMRNTCEMLLQDLPYIATNMDWVCPVSFGFVPDCGSMCEMYEHATGKNPMFIGKPEPTMIDSVRQKFGVSREETVVIGDRIYTDIASGLHAGVSTIAVLSGEIDEADILGSTQKPQFTFQSVQEIYELLKQE